MNYAEFVTATAKSAGVSKDTVRSVLACACDVAFDAINDGDEVTLSRLGKFSKKLRPARTGINPRTKQKITIPAKNVPVFKPSSEFKNAIE